MVIKLQQQDKDFEKRLEKATHQRFDRDLVQSMVKKYRKGTTGNPKALKFAHFNAYEILSLFIDNGVVSSTLKKAIEKEQTKIEGFGVRIYMGTHTAITAPPPRYGRDDYDGFHTTVICNTNIRGGRFYDILDNTKKILLPQGSGDGLDQAHICPPEFLAPCADDDCLEDVGGV